jgi:hypothetical protein
LSHSRNSLLSRQNADVIAILDKSIVSASSDVRERLSGSDVRAVQQSLSKCRNINNDVGRVDSFEDVICEKSCDCDCLVAVLDGYSFGLVAWNSGECVVGRCEDGDVGSCGKCVCKTVDEAHQFEQSTEVRLRSEKCPKVALSQTRASHDD